MSRDLKAFFLSFGLHAMIFMGIFAVSRTMVTLSRPILIDFSIEEPSLHSEDEKRTSPSLRGQTMRREEKRTNRPQEVVKEEIKGVTETPPQDHITEELSEEQVPVAGEKAPVVPATKPSLSNNSGQADQIRDSRSAHIASVSSSGGNSIEEARQRYIKEHFSYIRDIITRNLSYPYMARKMGWSGRVTLSFIVSESGAAMDIKILESSGFDLLDRNAVETVKKVSPFPKPPVRAEVIIPIVYRLN